MNTGNRPLNRLRFIALNIDGVLLPDTFSPVLRMFAVANGGAYDAALERRVFSQNRDSVWRCLADLSGFSGSLAEVGRRYFATRAEYLHCHPLHPVQGVRELLTRLRSMGLVLLCYGGLAEDHFRAHLGEFAPSFQAYVCTNDFRPGVQEIMRDVARCEPREICFVDDVARVAEVTRGLGIPFIGLPSPMNFQRSAMETLGVRHMVTTLDEIDEALLRRIDADKEV